MVGYYEVPRARRLMRDYDRMARIAKPVLAPHFDPEYVDAVVKETSREFLRLIPHIPHIGGGQNPLSDNLEKSAMLLALHRVLKARGMTLEEIAEINYKIVETYIASMPRLATLLSGWWAFTWFYRRSLKKRAKESQLRLYPGDWVFDYVEGDGKKFDFGVDYTECEIVKFLRAQGAHELTKHLCPFDYLLSDAMGLGLVRTTTLAEGGKRCDFRFKRGRRTTVLGPTSACPWDARAGRAIEVGRFGRQGVRVCDPLEVVR